MSLSTVADDYQAFRQQLETEVSKIEKTMAEMEAQYLGAEYSQCGTILKGLEGFLSSKDALRKRQRTYKPEDRLFSLSSRSSPVVREMEQNALDQQEGPLASGFGKKGYAQKSYAQKRFADKGKR